MTISPDPEIFIEEPETCIDQILSNFSLGISRVLSVVDGVPEYDRLLVHHLTETHQAEFSENLPLEVQKGHAIASARKKISRRPTTWLKPAFRDFACFGETRSNIREFMFFDEICTPLGISIMNANYKFAEQQPAGDLTPALLEAGERIEREIEHFYRTRNRISSGLVRQINLYSSAFYIYLLAFTSPGATWPKALVLANDHSPTNVALSMVFKGLKIPRIYLQHAEVSEAFPPLDFDHSVLRNTRSLEVYLSMQETHGATYILPRTTNIAVNVIQVPLKEPIKVVIYPTARLLGSGIRLTIEKLLSNPLVDEVAVKEHPNASARVADWVSDDRLQFLSEIPAYPHVAIVGNSSIAVELVANGIPVYHNFDFDPVTRDYYGTVRAGLMQEVRSEDLTGRFWKPYLPDAEWHRQLSRWMPTAESCRADYDAFRLAMNSLAQGSSSDCCRVTPLQTRPPHEGSWLSTVQSEIPRASAFQTEISVYATAADKAEISTRNNRSADPEKLKSRWIQTFVFRSHSPHKLYRRILRSLDNLRRHDSPRYDAQSIEPHALATEIKETDREKREVERKKKKEKADLVKRRVERQKTELVTSTLSLSNDPLTWIRMNQKTDVFDTIIVINAIERLIEQRDLSTSRIFEEHSKLDSESLICAWIELKRSTRSNLTMSSERLDQITEMTSFDTHSPALRATMTRALLPALIDHGSIEQLIRILDSGVIKWSRVALPHKVSILKRLGSRPSEQGRANKLRGDMLALAGDFERLKILNTEFFAGNPPEDWSHDFAERQFLKVAPDSIRIQFESQVLPVYNKLRSRMILMDVRTNAQQGATFLARVRDALVDHKGFSCIRLSDGEGYLFPDAGYFDYEDSLNRERHWWGVELSENERSAIQLHARQSLRDADIVGIPSIYRFIRDSSSKSQSLTSSVQGRGLLSCLHSVGNLDHFDVSVFSEDKFNVGLFSSIDVVLDLAAFALKLVIVSSIRPESWPHLLRELRHVDYVLLPTHNNTKSNDAYVQGDLPLPIVYPDLLEEFERKIGPGTLVLVAGGVIGKIFIGRSKELGAVALDIGHVSDDWVTSRTAMLR